MTAAALPADALLWLPRLEALFDCLRHPEKGLAPPPSGVPVAQLLAALKMLGATPGSVNPAADAAQVIAQRTANTRELLQDLVREVTPKVIAAVAEAPGEVEGVIRSADFGRVLPLFDSETGLTGATVFCGVIDSLPAGHDLRTACPDPYLHGVIRSEGKPNAKGEPSMTGEGLRVLALGPADNNVLGYPAPRPWYSLPDALAMTGRLRRRQVADDDAFMEKLRVEAAGRLNAYWASDLGQRELQRRQLEAERRAGRIPTRGAPIPDPDAAEGVGEDEAAAAQEALRQENERKERAARRLRAEVRGLRMAGRHAAAHRLAAKLDEAGRLRADGKAEEAVAMTEAALAEALQVEGAKA
jgi:hypothetical protein